MSSFPLAGEHSKIYHPTITNADLSHCAALLAFVQVFVRGENGTLFLGEIPFVQGSIKTGKQLS